MYFHRICKKKQKSWQSQSRSDFAKFLTTDVEQKYFKPETSVIYEKSQNKHYSVPVPLQAVKIETNTRYAAF